MSQYCYHTALSEESLLQALMFFFPLHLSCPSAARLLSWGAAASTRGWVSTSQGIQRWHRRGKAIRHYSSRNPSQDTRWKVNNLSSWDSCQATVWEDSYLKSRSPFRYFSAGTQAMPASSEKPLAPVSPADFNYTLPGWLEMTVLA